MCFSIQSRNKFGTFDVTLLVIIDSIPYSTILSVDNDISLVFLCEAFGFPDGRTLFSVFGRNTFVAFTTYRPVVFVGHYMLVPGPWSVVFLRALKKDF